MRPVQGDDPIVVDRESVQVHPVQTVRGPLGETLEPEQAPAARVLQSAATLRSPEGRALGGSIPVQIILESSAGEIAQGFRSSCFLCANWDVKAFRDYCIARAETPGGRAELQALADSLVVTGNGSGEAVRQLLPKIGVCRLASEIRKGPIFTHAGSTCPDVLPNEAGVADPRLVFGNHFQPKGKESERQGNQAFDAIMRSAQGKG